MAIREVELKKVVAPFQVRDPKSEALSDESIRQLADEMKVNGVWDLAIPAREVDGKFEIACGSRRMAAWKLLKMEQVRLDVKARTDEEMRRIAAAENTAREPLSQEEMRRVVRDFQTSETSEIASMLGVSDKYVGCIRNALKAIGETGAKADAEASSEVIDRASCLGPNAQKVVAEKAIARPTVDACNRALKEIRGTLGNQVAEAVKARLGVDLDLDPVEIHKAANTLKRGERKKKAKAAKKNGSLPPKLEKVLSDWTDSFNRFTKKLDVILSDKENLDYMKEFPFTAKEFRKAVANLNKRLEKVEAELAKF